MNIQVLVGEDYKSVEELFSSVSQILLEKGMVKNTFYKAITEREKSFPTGLRGKNRNIAIPHSDPNHIIKSGYIVIKNKEPLIFREMGKESEMLEVKIIIFILSNSSKGHMDLLRKTIDLANIEEELDSKKIEKLLKS